MNNQTEQINYTQTKVGLQEQDFAGQNKTLYSESVLNLWQSQIDLHKLKCS